MTTISKRNALHSGSIADRIANLVVGDNFTVSHTHGAAGDSFDAWVQATKTRLTNTIAPKVTQVKARHPERVYTTETGVMISGSNRAHVVLVVTRLADQG